MPRFVVLEHDHPELHWDLMLEHGGVLKTWRLPCFPPEPGKKIVAQALADHRLLYLAYQGPVSGNRGQVVRCDQGSYELVLSSAVAQDDPFKTDRLSVSLQGSEFCGRFILERMQGSDWRVWAEEQGLTIDN
jgi:hypothetical protein